MKGHALKTAVAATLERIWAASGCPQRNFRVVWGGEKAIVRHTVGEKGSVRAEIIFPDIPEDAEVTGHHFLQFIGYSIHQLGHVWFSREDISGGLLNKSISDGIHTALKLVKREDKGKLLRFLTAVMAALEDIRQEAKTIDAGYAKNAAPLLTHLTESMSEGVFAKGGVDPTDLVALPFIIGIEGRRLNGYGLTAPDLLSEFPWRTALQVAMDAALKAKSSDDLVDITLNLWAAIDQDPPELPPEPPPPPGGDGQDEDEGDEKRKGDGGDGGDGDEQGDGEGGEESDSDDEEGSEKRDEKRSKAKSKEGKQSRKTGLRSGGESKGNYIPEKPLIHMPEKTLEELARSNTPPDYIKRKIPARSIPKVIGFQFVS